MNESCEAGISYAEVRIDRPFKFPCLKQGGQCLHSRFPSENEVSAQIDEITNGGIKTMRALAKITEHYRQTKQANGIIKCHCGGELGYTVASTNGHIWAVCSKCKMSFGQ